MLVIESSAHGSGVVLYELRARGYLSPFVYRVAFIQRPQATQVANCQHVYVHNDMNKTKKDDLSIILSGGA